jgi:hypothetical protein
MNNRISAWAPGGKGAAAVFIAGNGQQKEWF